jgi:catechol 2,3-dioxygenase-like lactoylglutathione lyase family enzyme
MPSKKMPSKKKKKSEPADSGSELSFNHAMVYSRNLAAALDFYAGKLGFEILEQFQWENRTVYARLKPRGGDGTIALHALAADEEMKTGGVRLYFEIKNLDRFCKRQEALGVKFSKPPALMPWGWKHAYLDDPDGHEVSLYTAGAKRLRKAKPPRRP